MLDVADEIESYTGYQGPPDRQEIAKLQRQFDQLRREFVYAAIKNSSFPALVWASVAADLDRIDATNEHSFDAVNRVRTALKRHLAKQLATHTVLRMATRWTVPVGSAVIVGIVWLLEISPIVSNMLPDWIPMPAFLK